jgi:hypothetical protein
MLITFVVKNKQNYGPLFELVPAGIAGGPVKLVGANGTAIDLTKSSWSYKVRRRTVFDRLVFSSDPPG